MSKKLYNAKTNKTELQAIIDGLVEKMAEMDQNHAAHIKKARSAYRELNDKYQDLRHKQAKASIEKKRAKNNKRGPVVAPAPDYSHPAGKYFVSPEERAKRRAAMEAAKKAAMAEKKAHGAGEFRG